MDSITEYGLQLGRNPPNPQKFLLSLHTLGFQAHSDQHADRQTIPPLDNKCERTVSAQCYTFSTRAVGMELDPVLLPRIFVLDGC
jgi:hypothetical protein